MPVLFSGETAVERPVFTCCYAWIRYRQFSDNLIDAMFFHMKQVKDESLDITKKFLADVHNKHSVLILLT